MTIPEAPSPKAAAAQPSHLTSRMSLTVRFCETDLMGIVHHANYLVYFEAGRVDWLHRRGIQYESWAKRGIHLPVVEARLRYRKAARFDEELVVETTCGEVTRVTVRFTYRILRGADLLCEGDTTLACVGPNLAPMRIPPDIAEVFRSAEIQPPSGAPASVPP
jgi:acyl-CoA thioester hydrolase